MEYTENKRGFFKTVGLIFDITRKVIVNLAFWLFALAILGYLLSDKSYVVRGDSVLLIQPEGVVVDTLSEKFSLSDSLPSRQKLQVAALDIISSLKNAKDDSRINSVIFNGSGIYSCSFANAQEIAEAIVDYRESGKDIVFYDVNYAQTSYYLASFCSEVVVDPLGSFSIPGFGIYSPYFKKGFDKIGVEWNIFRAGEYKSAVEPFTRNNMSEESKQNTMLLLDDLWSVYVEDISKARGIDSQLIKDFSSNPLSSLRANNGNQAKSAIDLGFADTISSMNDIYYNVDSNLEDNITFVDYNDYLSSFLNKKNSSPSIGLIVLEGDITSSGSGPNIINGAIESQKIIDVANDSSIEAVVVRINSGGGGITASEEIRRAVEYCSDKKPIVVSMGGVCASGGYWISSAADLVYANSTTITGSIGVFGMIPTAQKAMRDYLGISFDGVGTGPYSGGIRIDRAMTANEKELFQLGIDFAYQNFLEIVAKGRSLPLNEVEEVASGRVFTGGRALEYGLVDELGGLRSAIDGVAELAGLEKYKVIVIQDKMTLVEKMLADMMRQSVDVDSGLNYYILSLRDHAFKSLFNLAMISDPSCRYVWSFENFMLY
ncbi:MAG: signal peptide peptidase SppA [Spirochaetales bacterium]|nr:signal peptide peptidase SppA [Spirochaetales bacterium]